MAQKPVRIPIPVNPDDQITLAKAVLAKHKALGAQSPLSGLDMAAFEAQLTIADAQNVLAKQLARDAEAATQARDGALGSPKGPEVPGTVKFFLRAGRDALAAVNRGNEKKLGDFGYTVDDSPRPPAAAKPKPKP